MPDLTRRQFLGEASCASIGATSLLSSLLGLRLTAGLAEAAPVGAGADYKALVCLFLAGGNDSFNMLVPRQDDAFAEYAGTRSTIALPGASLLPIDSVGQPYSEFGLHPKLENVRNLYNAGDAAFLANVGTLIEPLTLAEYASRRDLIPRGLFSHSDQQFHWQTVVPQLRGGRPSGWAGRVQELLRHANEQGSVSMNVSLGGLNVFQSARDAVTFSVSSAGLPEIRAYEDPVEKLAIRSLLEQDYRNLHRQAVADRTLGGVENIETFSAALEGVSLSTLFPATPTGDNLRMIANIIAARGPLGMDRQIFYVVRGGWDHHAEVLESQNGLFEEIDGAIGAFHAALAEIGMADQVTLFTASDFGRTLSSNGQGSDHAWGGNHLVTGGAVQGGRIYGEYPSLATGSDVDVGRGRLLPTTSVDHYTAELASWFGVPAGEMETLLPNVRNFFDPVATPRPLGFMS